MVNISFSLSIENFKKNYQLSNHAFSLLKTTFQKHIPFNSIIDAPQSFLIKSEISHILNNESLVLNDDEILQLTNLFFQFEYIFNRSLKSYYEPNIYSGSYTLSLENLN